MPAVGDHLGPGAQRRAARPRCRGSRWRCRSPRARRCRAPSAVAFWMATSEKASASSAAATWMTGTSSSVPGRRSAGEPTPDELEDLRPEVGVLQVALGDAADACRPSSKTTVSSGPSTGAANASFAARTTTTALTTARRSNRVSSQRTSCHFPASLSHCFRILRRGSTALRGKRGRGRARRLAGMGQRAVSKAVGDPSSKHFAGRGTSAARGEWRPITISPPRRPERRVRRRPGKSPGIGRSFATSAWSWRSGRAPLRSRRRGQGGA